MASQNPESPTRPYPIKCVFVGNDQVGKTSILYRLFNSKPPPIEDFPNVSDNQVLNVRYGMPSLCDVCDHQTLNMELSGQKYSVSLRDTSYQAERLRPLTYPAASLAIICFSIADVHSFHAIESPWVEEIDHFHPRGIPKIIIGNKIDRRTHRASTEETTKKKQKQKQNRLLPFRGKDVDIDPIDKDRSVSHEEGMRLAETIGAVAYVECSAMAEEGIGKSAPIFSRAYLW
ncbi:hypothetical protein GX50_00870 [[Emmonsia] crescens]|uniref:Rho family, other n=1 Tax=[Emmonsia] crescens TaxID=73230 RepID=A0A2B7ZIQ9_9EURO|nr:hypothetical protein GX50_00870 [Emmonsia crescens]